MNPKNLHKFTQMVVEGNPKEKKAADNLNKALEDLRKDLVITTGDHYVASAEPELREKMGELYSNVASAYDRVSGAHKLNYELVSEDFTKAKKRYSDILSKEGKKFNFFVDKNNITRPEIKSKEEFLKKE